MTKVKNSFDLAKNSSENQIEKIDQVVYSAIANSKETPLRLGDLTIDCYVLDDKDGTAVISKTGLCTALGISSGGGKIEKLLHDKLNLSKTGREPEYIVGEVLSDPIKFKLKSSNGLNSLIPVAYGYKADILIDICNAVIWARDSGINISDKIYLRAKAIIMAAAKTGLKAMIYEATGYERIKKSDVYMRFFNSILSEEAKKWEKFFEDDGFLKDLAVMKHVSWAKPGCYPLYFGKLLNDLVYSRIAPNLMLELTTRNPKINKHRKYCHHQFFKNNGEELAKKHIDKLRLLAKASGYNWELFMAMVNNAMPVQPQTDIEDLLIEENIEDKD